MFSKHARSTTTRPLQNLIFLTNGEWRIRTSGHLTTTTVFETAAFNQLCQLSKSTDLRWKTQRWGRDSNSGWTYAHNGFQDRRYRPLSHPTQDLKNKQLFKNGVKYTFGYIKGDIAEINEREPAKNKAKPESKQRNV